MNMENTFAKSNEPLKDNFDKLNFFSDLNNAKVLDYNKTELTTELLREADKLWDQYNKDGSLNAQKIGGTTGKRYSDRWDDTGRQVVDLVQEGGGMLGIALVGYTYILEKAGLRFVSLAGTSAGGINTMMIAALPNSIYQSSGNQQTKSEMLAHIIANTQFSRFIDRKGFINKVLVAAIQPAMRTWLLLGIFVCGLLASVLAYTASTFFFSAAVLTDVEYRIYLYLGATLATLFPFIVLFLLLKVVLGENFGINPGQVFKDWVHDLLTQLGVKDTDTLVTQCMSPIDLYDENNNLEKANNRKLVLITSNLTYNRIVKFPDKAKDYWQNSGKVYPANYVRATMSIPFFFEVFTPADQSNGAKVQLKSRFVDGGMLSNFPIREFHVSTTPRFPTFGIKLGLDQKSSYKRKETLLKYILSFFSTFKQFYDNAFLNDDPETRMLISNIDTGKANWLNFWMTPEEKKELFREGAKAACDFLRDFDWVAYKKLR